MKKNVHLITRQAGGTGTGSPVSGGRFRSVGPALVLIALGATLILGTQETRTLGERVSMLLVGLPAPTAAERTTVAAGLVALGSSGIAEVCVRLAAPGTADDSLARYALDAVALHVTQGPEVEPARLMFVREIGKALSAPLDPEVAGFLIGLLRLAGRGESVRTLAPFLKSEDLCGPAARALTTIGGAEAEAALLRALDPSRPKTAANLVPALGSLRARGAVRALERMAVEKDPSLREAVLDALAEIAAPGSRPLFTASSLLVSPLERARAAARYLTFARRGFEAGRKDEAEAICRDFLRSWIGPGEGYVRASALALLADIRGAAVLDDLLLAAGDPDAVVRQEALALAERIPGDDATSLWISRAALFGGDALADLIAMLGRRGNRAALSLVLDRLGSDDRAVRIAAIEAAPRLGGEAAFEALRPLILTEDPDQIRAVKEAYLAVPGDAPVAAAAEALPGAPPAAATALIEILAERKASGHAGAVLASAASGDADVRKAAAAALEVLAGPSEVPALIELLSKTPSGPEIAAVQNALVAAANRIEDQEARADALLAAASGASAARKGDLIRPLARIGGGKALASVKAWLADAETAVRAAALYALSSWKDPEALDALFETARAATDRRTRTLCLQGIARLSGSAAGDPARALDLLRDAFALAVEPEEKAVVAAAFGSVRTIDSLRAAAALLDDPAPAVRSRAAQAIARAALPGPGFAGLGGFEAAAILKKAALFIENDYDRGEVETFAHDALRRAGFVPLFNGKDLAGWKGLVADPPKRAAMTASELRKAQAEADADMRTHWRVIDGVLVFDGEGRSLCTVRDYADFEMFVDWEIQPKGDSGIYLRGSPQVQIWDETQSPDGSGGLYNNQKNPSKPLLRADRPAGEWNTFHIRMAGERVSVELNGILVTDNVVMENYWERSEPIYPSGQVELQSHNTPLRFKNIYLRELPPGSSAALRAEPRLPSVEPGFTPLFNGRDLSGWTGDLKGYAVENGVIAVLPSASGNLYTGKEYRDFVFRFEFKLTPGANNGIGIRAPLQGDAAYVGMEIQVLDDSAEVYKSLQPYQYHGSIYGVVPAERGHQKPVGEWNAEEIEARGRRVKVTLNGSVIVDADIDQASAGGTMDKRDHPGLRNETGHIGFLGHGSRVEFRNLRIRELGSN
jgi:HEAT repeat protein